MNTIITGAQAFDDIYKKKRKNISFHELLNFAIDLNILTKEQATLIINKYKSNMINIILPEYDENVDIYVTLKRGIKPFEDGIDDYLSTFESPHKALLYIINQNPLDVIEYTKDRYENIKCELYQKVNRLYNDSLLLVYLNAEYNRFLAYLKQKIKGQSGYTIYRLMSGNDAMRANTLLDLSTVIDDASIELSILNKFPSTEVEHMLKKFKMSDISKNIVETALYNYVFNSYYKDDTSLVFTKNQNNIVEAAINNGLYDEEDVIDIIENGNIQFDNCEKDYIYTYFVPLFKKEIIGQKHIDTTIKI